MEPSIFQPVIVIFQILKPLDFLAVSLLLLVLLCFVARYDRRLSERTRNQVHVCMLTATFLWSGLSLFLFLDQSATAARVGDAWESLLTTMAMVLVGPLVGSFILLATQGWASSHRTATSQIR